MLKYFFEKTDVDAVNSYLFENLNIWQAGDEYINQLGKYPVIFLTFKDVKDANWQSSYNKLQRLIIEEYERHNYLLNNQILTSSEKDFYCSIISKETTQDAFEESLKYLSKFLERYHQSKVMILIDEYDAPIESGYINGYYDQIINFMRNLLSGGLKDNPSLEKGILTGILRVAKESVFSGLNNLSVYSLLNEKFNKQFGLLEEEVEKFLYDYGIKDKLDEVKEWYNGYNFGGKMVYNPWSIVKYIEKAGVFEPYWVNTSAT